MFHFTISPSCHLTPPPFHVDLRLLFLYLFYYCFLIFRFGGGFCWHYISKRLKTKLHHEIIIMTLLRFLYVHILSNRGRMKLCRGHIVNATTRLARGKTEKSAVVSMIPFVSTWPQADDANYAGFPSWLNVTVSVLSTKQIKWLKNKSWLLLKNSALPMSCIKNVRWKFISRLSCALHI